jgi:hypothetical protein
MCLRAQVSFSLKGNNHIYFFSPLPCFSSSLENISLQHVGILESRRIFLDYKFHTLIVINPHPPPIGSLDILLKMVRYNEIKRSHSEEIVGENPKVEDDKKVDLLNILGRLS